MYYEVKEYLNNVEGYVMYDIADAVVYSTQKSLRSKSGNDKKLMQSFLDNLKDYRQDMVTTITLTLEGDNRDFIQTRCLILREYFERLMQSKKYRESDLLTKCKEDSRKVIPDDIKDEIFKACYRDINKIIYADKQYCKLYVDKSEFMSQCISNYSSEYDITLDENMNRAKTSRVVTDCEQEPVKFTERDRKKLAWHYLRPYEQECLKYIIYNKLDYSDKSMYVKVWRLLLDGKTNVEIGKELNKGESSIRRYRIQGEELFKEYLNTLSEYVKASDKIYNYINTKSALSVSDIKNDDIRVKIYNLVFENTKQR